MRNRFFSLRFASVCVFSLLFSLAVFQNAQAQNMRVWPQTKNGIYVFTDQLDQSLTVPQWKFSAEHFIGSMRIIKDRVDLLRKYNSNFIILQYFLGQGTGSHIHDVIGNDWVDVWDTISQQPGCFLTSEKSSHPQKWIRETEWNWYLADIDSPCWLNFVKTEVDRRKGNDHFDGVFLDSASEPGYPFEPSEWWPTGDWADGDPDYLPYWIPKLTTYFEEVYGYFKQDEHRQYVIPNVGHFVAVYSAMKWDNTDGIFIEGFSRWVENKPFNLHDWRLQMNRVLNYIQSGKVFIAHSYTTREHIRDRMFIMGSFLLTKGNQSYISMSTEEDKKFPEWYPEYEIDLGSYMNLPGNIDELKMSNGLYARQYEKGLVIVNPTEQDINFAVPKKEMWRVEIAGGGEVWADGNFVPGVLSTTRVSGMLTVPTSTAVILLDIRPEPQVLITPSNLKVQPFFSYLQPRLQATGVEQELALRLKADLVDVFGGGRLGVSGRNWSKLVNAYIYGGYPSQAIAQAMRFNGRTVHPWIPWKSFKETTGYKEYFSLGFIRSENLPVGNYAYGRARLASSTEEQWLAQSLRQQIDTAFRGRKYSVSSENWQILVNAYIYGGYPVPSIVRAIEHGGHTVHPSIPWLQWKDQPMYRECMRKPSSSL